MTACKDSLNGKKAVSATLAGVLAVGMVPAAAFAATDAQAADTQDEQGIELQAATESAQFAKAKVLSATDVNNAAISGDLAAISFKVNGAVAQQPTIQQVEVTKVSGEKVVEQVTDTSKYKQEVYKADANGNITENKASEQDLKAAGKFFVKVTATDGTFEGGALNVPFEIKAQALDGATLYEVNADDETDLSDTTFTYNGGKFNNKATQKSAVLGVVLNGEALDTDDYTIDVYAKGAKIAEDNKTEALAAGEYFAVITGTDGDIDGQTAEIPFTIEKLDLSKVAFDTISQVAGDDAIEPHFGGANDAGLVKVDGTAYAVPDISLTQTTAGSFGKAGSYEFAVKATDSKNANITGEGTVKVNLAETLLSGDSFRYGKKALSEFCADGGTKTIEHADGDADFVPSKVAVYTDVAKKTELDASKYSVKIYNSDNEEVSSASKAGTYSVKVVIEDPANKYTGSYSFSLTVNEGTIESDGTAFIYDGNATQSVSKVYDGENVLDKLQVVVKDSEGNTLAEGEDYTLKIKKGSKEVDEIVDAGTYTIVVDAPGYTLDDDENTCTVTIAKVSATLEIDGIYAAASSTNPAFLAYTGESITPSFKYAVKDADGELVEDENGEQVYAELPSDVYTVTYVYNAKKNSDFAAVDEMKDKGYYKVKVVLNDTDAAKNYTLVAASGANVSETGQTTDPTTFNVRVADERNFKDVATGDWYNDAVNKISSEDYGELMTGYSETKLFGPNDNMTRAQVAKILGMAAGVETFLPDGTSTSIGGYVTPFSDVDGGAWYAAYVAWAANTGIVTGYGDTGLFGPDDSITREQFCLMLQRFAEKFDMYEAADGTALAAMPDAAGVSDWAKEAVAWAVDKGYIGKGGVVDAQGVITRAQSAQILVRFIEDNGLVGDLPMGD